MPLFNVSSMELNELGHLAFNAVSVVWLELVMFSVAAVVYLLFNGGLARAPVGAPRKKEEDLRPEQTPRATVEAWQKGESSVPVLAALSAMQTLGWDTGAVLGALEAALRARPHLRSTAQINELVADLARRGERDLLDGVLELLPGLQVQPDPRSYEVLLEAHCCLENFHEVKSLAARLRQAGTQLTPRMLSTAAMAALRTQQLPDLRLALQDL